MTNKEADVYVLTFSHYIEDKQGKRTLANAPFTINGIYGYGLRKVNDYKVFHELSMQLHDALFDEEYKKMSKMVMEKIIREKEDD